MSDSPYELSYSVVIVVFVYEKVAFFESSRYFTGIRYSTKWSD